MKGIIMFFQSIKKAISNYLKHLAKVNKEEFGDGPLKCQGCGMKCTAEDKKACSFFDMNV